MKKKNWIVTMVLFAICTLSLLLMVACKKKEAPQAPTGVNANVSGSTIRITWNSVEDADSYSITNGNGSSLGDTYSTSYIDYSPSEGYNYYRVYARNEYGRSFSYGTASCYYHEDNGGGNNGGGNDGGNGGGGSSTISAPTGVSAEVSGSRVCVTWNSVSNASYYRVYRSSSSSGYYSMLESSSNTYYYDASPNTSYNYYKVTAVNSSGTESDKSDYAYCYYSTGGGGGGGGGVTVPDAPTGVTATNIGSTMVPDVKITWNSVSNATGYKVYKSTSPNSGYTQHGSETTTTYLYDHNPSQGNNYYKVKAVNSAGESSYSSYAMVNINSNDIEPCPPSVSASGTSNSISVSWTASTSSGCGRPTSYEVHKYNPINSSWEQLTTTTSTSYTDRNVHPGVNRYAVKAINQFGYDIGYGNSSTITLPKPTSFTAQKSGSDYVKFTWSKVSQATGYQIFESTSAYGTYTILDQVDDVNTTTFSRYFPGESGHTYYFKIRAIWYVPGTFEYSDFTTYKSVTF